MKYMKRSNTYQASNVTFNVDTCSAYSYGWWAFVKRIKGKVIFNAYQYSNSTTKHQYKVRSLLQDLGIRIDREVQVKRGLQNITTLKLLNAEENDTLDAIAEEQEYKRKMRNERARKRRAAAKQMSLSIVAQAEAVSRE